MELHLGLLSADTMPPWLLCAVLSSECRGLGCGCGCRCSLQGLRFGFDVLIKELESAHLSRCR